MNNIPNNMDIENLHTQQQIFFNSNKTKEVIFRIEQLKKFKKILEDNESLMYKAIYEDFGKSEFDTCILELSFLHQEINNFIRNIKRWSKRKKVPTGFVNFPAKSYIILEPLGITLVIGTWNYPYRLSLAPAIASLAAGNTVLLKPSELSPKTSKVMAQIVNDHFPNNYFHVVEGGVKETTALLKYKFDKIFFTGSVPVGKLVYQAAAKHLTPITLELGGKSPTFVLSDANLKITAKRIVWAKFLNAGQTCVAPDYILVDRSIEERFLEAMKSEIEQQYGGSGDIDEHYVKIINANNFDRLCKLMDNDKIYLGGHIDREKRFIAPTILQNVSFEDDVMKEEIFGPLLPVISFTNLDEIVEKVKKKPKPLACYIYSKNRKKIDKLLKEVSFGGGCVNDSLMHLSNENLPFGGVGLSGIGSYHGKAGIDTFSHKKSILDKPFWFEPNLKYAPHSKKKMKIIKWML